MLSPYTIMWSVVLFDLPSNTETERRRYTQFRKHLIREGYFMKQFSVYMQWVPSKDKATALADRIEQMIPFNGHVSILTLTDKQYGMTRNFYGLLRLETEQMQEQLVLL